MDAANHLQNPAEVFRQPSVMQSGLFWLLLICNMLAAMFGPAMFLFILLEMRKSEPWALMVLPFFALCGLAAVILLSGITWLHNRFTRAIWTQRHQFYLWLPLRTSLVIMVPGFIFLMLP